MNGEFRRSAEQLTAVIAMALLSMWAAPLLIGFAVASPTGDDPFMWLSGDLGD
jgi:hypothetical protein